ncbi:MAG: UDP-N-acetylglucosamine 2-epimerase (non-hydrolyzing) [Bacteroidetes bacterium]|nr:UDP-N-acetylglucosamine 2-epimerase (non-hydrolyzing) [Bacteroidota bacterium]
MKTPKKKFISVVGTRPNFIKLAPLYNFFKSNESVIHLVCHTGQHYDFSMSKVFFQELQMPEPDFFLGITGNTHAEQTANIMTEFEKLLEKEKPDLIIVFGDVNSTMACSLAASKLNIKIAHVEAGLRSFDRTMPEEVNRIITDVLSDFLFISEQSGLINLKKEGISEEKYFFTGNIMIDSLVHNMDAIDNSKSFSKFNLDSGNYLLATFHRPSNVDKKENFLEIIDFLLETSKKIKIIFPVHPRTLSNIKNMGLLDNFNDNIILTEPLGYIDFLCLVKNAAIVVTDSGGIQEETTFLGVPCITFRDNTERPATVDIGTNILAGTSIVNLKKIMNVFYTGKMSEKKQIPEFWDGKTAVRIGNILLEKFYSK